VEPETLWRIEKGVRKQNTEAEIVYTHYSEINLSPILSRITPRKLVAPAPQRAPQAFKGASLKQVHSEHGGTAVKEIEEHSAASFSQVTAITMTLPNTRTTMPSKQQLESFFQEWGDILLRAKGHIQLNDQEPVQLVQYAGMRTTWEASRYPGMPYVVFIGLNIDEEQLADRWTALFEP